MKNYLSLIAIFMLATSIYADKSIPLTGDYSSYSDAEYESANEAAEYDESYNPKKRQWTYNMHNPIVVEGEKKQPNDDWGWFEQTSKIQQEQQRQRINRFNQDVENYYRRQRQIDEYWRNQ